MSEFKIEKNIVELKAKITGQAETEGKAFLAPVYENGQPQKVIELLNEPEPFFPFLNVDRSLQLIHKANLLYVLVPAEDELKGLPDIASGAIVTKNVRMMMTDHTMISGQLHIEAQVGFMRPIDQLNRGSKYVYVRKIDENLIYLVHVQNIAAVFV